MIKPGARNRPTIGVIICCYTLARWDKTMAAIDSLENQTIRPDELIVVVDHNDRLYRWLSSQRLDVKVLANTGVRGLSAARNTGIEAATTDIVAFLDDDAAAEPDWVSALLAGYADPAVIGVGGHVEPVWTAGRPDWFPGEFDWVVGCSHAGMPAAEMPVRNLIGANMSFRRAALISGDGFSTRLGRVGRNPVGCEETELCIRIVQRNPSAVLAYRPAARVRHHVTADRATWGYFRRRCYAEGLSKALVAGLVGRQRGLASERDYTTRVLTRGLLAALAARRPVRAAAIVAGLGATILGYTTGSIRPRLSTRLVGDSA